METQKPLLKDEDGEEVDVHMYRSMIGSLMYLTSSRPNIMFVACVYARYQVNPKVSHLYVVKRIFRYLKGQPKLGLWYPKDSPFNLVAYTNSDYVGASLDRKFTTGGCQFLGCRLISWQCKKQTVVANSITEAEYVAASSCCRQVLWIQNQLLDYGTKHIERRNHFIRDCNEKKLIQMVKIDTDKNAVDLLTKAFDVRKAKKSVKLMMEKLFRMELELMLAKVNAVEGIFINTPIKKRFSFDLVAYTDSDYAGASLDRKSTTEGYQFLGCRLISWQCKKQTVVANSTTEVKYVAASSCCGQFWSTVMVKTINGEAQLHALVDGKKIIVTESSVRRYLQLADEEGEGLAIPTDLHHTPTFIQPSTQPQKTQQLRKTKRKDTLVPQPSDPIKNVADEVVHKELGDSLVRAATTTSSLEAEQDSGGGPWCQETIRDTIAQTRFESVSKHSNDSLLVRGNTLRCEDILKLDELMALCTTLQNWVLDLEKTKTTQHNEIAKSSDNEESLGEDASKQGRIDAIDADVSAGEDVFATTVDDITLAQVLKGMKSTKSKKTGVVIQELGESTTTISSQLSSQQSQDKGKGILIEHVKPVNKKDLIRLDEETALNLQAEFDEEERLAREKAEKEEEANFALIETWDHIHEKIDVDH
ncbi:hypothetical protein Tco_0752935 [Tanacetum coccineum]